MTKPLLLAALLAPLLLTTAPARADEGGTVGGGGDAIRQDIEAIRDYVLDNCDRWEAKGYVKSPVSCKALKDKIDAIGTDPDHLRIEDKVDLGDGKDRDGRNRCYGSGAPGVTSGMLDVTFSRSRWQKETDVFRKIGIFTHEIFGCLGLEKTDDYKFSKPLSMELRKFLGAEFKIVPGSIAFDLVTPAKQVCLSKSAGTCEDMKYVSYDANGKPRLELRGVGVFDYNYVARGVPYKRQKVSEKEIRAMNSKLKFASKACPVSVILERSSGKIVSFKTSAKAGCDPLDEPEPENEPSSSAQ